MASLNNFLDDIPLSVFEDLEHTIKNNGQADFIKLHQGKTTFAPCARLFEWTASEFELLAHQHASPLGINTLKHKLVDKLRGKTSREINEKNILITSGATHAIGIILRAILETGDEVLILSPQWLFITGLVKAAGGFAKEVPIFLELYQDPNFDFVGALQANVTPKTKAIYFNTPNNPTGYSLDRRKLQKLAAFAKDNGLWIISDNAYEIYDFTNEGFIEIADIPEATNITFSIYSFSKTYAMPGYRIGYMVVPENVGKKMQKWGLYSVYSISTASQFGAFQALNINPEVLASHNLRAKQARDITLQNLIIPHTQTQGGLYTFLNLSAWKKGTCDDFIFNCIQHGVSVAPGKAFGQHHENYARLCFTATDSNGLNVAIKRLNSVYEG